MRALQPATGRVGALRRVRRIELIAVLGPLVAVGAGAILVVSPLGRAILLALALIGVAWVALLPRGWFPRRDPKTSRVIGLFLGVRLLMPVVSVAVSAAATLLFTGGTDADKYHAAGLRVATELLLTGHSASHGALPGNGAVELAVGYFYAYGAPVRLLGYYVWNLFAVIGMLLFWWATEHLVAPVHRRRYTAFVLLTPTLLFWNAGLGKEAPLTFATGCIVAGIHLLSGRSRGFRGLAYLGLGVVVAGFVRPHIALLLMVSAVIGMSFGGIRAPTGRRYRRVLPVLVLTAAGLSLLPVTQHLLDPSGDRSFVDAAYATAESTATVGGRSAFQTAPTRSVTDVPSAVVTVLLRPFPWEVRTVPQLLASAEATIIGFLFFRMLWRVVRLRMAFVPSPLVLASGVFVLLFCLVFASLGNFGLLVRERMQVLPFVVLLTLSARPVGASADTSRRSVSARPTHA